MGDWNDIAEKSTGPSDLLTKEAGRVGFFLILCYLFLEYGRPQALVAPLRIIPLSTIVAVLLFLSLLTKAKVKLRDKQTKCFVLFLGLLVIHGPIAANNHAALMSFNAMVYNFVAFLSLSYFVNNEERFRKLIDAWILIHVLVAVIGFLHNGRGAGGFLGDENDLCLTLNMVLPFPFFLAMTSNGITRKIYYCVLACLFLVAIIVTESRGGFLGLVATGLYCWWKSNRKILSASIVVLLILSALVFAPASYWDEVRSIAQETSGENSTGTGAARRFKWRMAWIMFLDNPVIGVGQGNFRYSSINYQEQVGRFNQRSMAGREAHSLYFTLLSELGLTGTVLFGLMVLYMVLDMRYVQRSAQKKRGTSAGGLPYESMASTVEASLIGYLSSGAFISVLYYPNFWVLAGFAVALRKIFDQQQNFPAESKTYAKPGWRTLPEKWRRSFSKDMEPRA